MSGFVYPGDKRRAKLDSIQSKRLDQVAEIAEAESAGISPTEYVAAVRSRLEQASADSSLRFHSDLMRHFGRPRDGYVSADLGEEKPLTLADVAWLFGADEIATRIAASNGIEGVDNVMTHSERQTRLVAGREQLRNMEIEEEREILRLQEGGVMVLRREDVDPHVLLEVWQEGHSPAPKMPQLSVDRPPEGNNEAIRGIQSELVIPGQPSSAEILAAIKEGK